MTPALTPLAHLTALNFSAALTLLDHARALNVRGSYHPRGGAKYSGCVPVTHNVYLLCDEKTAAQIERNSHAKN